MTTPLSTPIDLARLPGFAAASLKTALEALDVCPEPEIRRLTIHPQALTPAGAKNFLDVELAKLPAKSPTLYRIGVPADLNPELVLQAFDAGKTKSAERSFSRRHGPRSRFLYVGRSSSIRKRIYEHLGFGARGTYALNLACWAQSLGVPLDLECASYGEGISPLALPHLEDALWTSSMPMFGRQGSV